MESKIQEILTKTNLDWNVSKQRLVTETGIAIEDRVAIVRSDNNKVLGVMGEGYQEFQNYALIELLFKISQHTGLELHKGGDFQDGRKVYAQLKSDNLTLGSDRIEGYITACSSHDGSTSLAFGNSTLVISCLNTFYKNLKNLDSKLKHTSSMIPRLDFILRGVDKILEEEQEDFKIIGKLNQIEITPEINDLVVRTLFNLSKQDMLIKDKLSTRTQNNILRFQSDWDKEIAQKGNSLWSAFNSSTRYSSHNQYNNPEKAMLNKLMGKTGENERKLWHELSAMVR